jgi:hypothetical protein
MSLRALAVDYSPMLYTVLSDAPKGTDVCNTGDVFITDSKTKINDIKIPK